MTKEEAKRKVREYLTDILPSDCSNEIDEIMKALEQPSCKDAISRTELIQKLNAWDSKAHGIPNYTWKVIREMPPVTPTSKDIKEAYLKGYYYGVKDWFKSKTQPCDDAVSRKRVIILIDEASEIHPYKVVGDYDTYSNYNQGWSDACDWLYANIEGISSVTPQSSKGKWIKIQSGDEDFPESIVCSRCKCENSHIDFNEHSEPIGKIFVMSKYCPNCGSYNGGSDNGDE